MFPRRSFSSSGLSNFEVLRRLGRDTAIQWHHWGSDKIDPKASSFLNFATMASYSCILAYLGEESVIFSWDAAGSLDLFGGLMCQRVLPFSGSI